MQTEPLADLIQPIKSLLLGALPKDLATSLAGDIEAKVQKVFKQMALVPKHEFEAQEALLHTLETQIASLEARLGHLEGHSDNIPTADDSAES